MTGTYTTTSSFTITHARHLASKIAADLHLCSQFYGKPRPSVIPDYAEELALLLRDGYVSQYEFGFKINGKRIVCWRYVVEPNGTVTTDDSAGKLFPYGRTTGSVYYNFMSYSSKWDGLSGAQKSAIKATLPIRRTAGHLPADGNGSWVSDRSYSSGGVGLSRKTFKPSVA